MNDKILTGAKVSVLVSTTILIFACIYLALTNPAWNAGLARSIELEEQRVFAEDQAKINERNSNLKEWNIDYLSDVNASEETYPIVVLRDSYKIIKIDATTTTVGWRMDLANTSPSNRYDPEIDYSITDGDGFKIGSASGSGILNENSTGRVIGTLEISNSDLDRLVSSDSTWTIAVVGWNYNEEKTKGARYGRLAELLSDSAKRPWWVGYFLSEPDNALQIRFSDKWTAVKKAIGPEATADNDEAQDVETK